MYMFDNLEPNSLSGIFVEAYEQSQDNPLENYEQGGYSSILSRSALGTNKIILKPLQIS